MCKILPKNVIKILLIFLVVFLLTSCGNNSTVTPTNSNISRKIDENLLLGIDGDKSFALWDFTKGRESSDLVFDINKNIKNISIELGLDSPNGTKATIVMGHNGYNLIVLSKQLLKSAFDKYGELNDGYYIQASIFDFDKDGDNEVVLSIGNKSTELGLSIFKYANNDFNQIGYIEGQSQAYINKDGAIEIYNSTGNLLNTYKWNGVEFTKL
jgi:hypothetical protein